MEGDKRIIGVKITRPLSCKGCSVGASRCGLRRLERVGSRMTLSELEGSRGLSNIVFSDIVSDGGGLAELRYFYKGPEPCGFTGEKVVITVKSS